ncbi:DNA adenine methylase [Konateibacter massiliensis]|uniref:DNA adenine methylase n=1 Tax=Konateibacter massiliensis TaxID=2002841 RepID=UPI000C15057D|nr:DNA adenine methylase [Konateibacter massiliensis]
MPISIKENKMSPLLKYPGGKDKELKYILPNIPEDAENYYEPFVGGGAVFFAVDSGHYFINDKSTELVNLYKMIAEQNGDFLRKINEIDQNWAAMSDIAEHHIKELSGIYKQYKKKKINEKQLSGKIEKFVKVNETEFNGIFGQGFQIFIDNFTQELSKSFQNKMVRMEKLEKEKGELPAEDVISNLEGAFKNAFYMQFRYLYNNIRELDIQPSFATAIYFFIREYCYSSMFRYNRDGKFNVPYGGISYNKKSLAKKIEYFGSDLLVGQLRNTTIVNDDFEAFFKAYPPAKKDFIFLDPPYDTEFSTYAKNEFDQSDQARLADFLIKGCKARFMLVIKNTDYILSLYPEGQAAANGGKLCVNKFDKRYFVSFQDRNDKEAEHLMITNYPL